MPTLINLFMGSASTQTFEFSASLGTFVPIMAKRIAPGPFAAAPIVQGKADGTGVPDVLSFSRGNQVV